MAKGRKTRLNEIGPSRVIIRRGARHRIIETRAALACTDRRPSATAVDIAALSLGRLLVCAGAKAGADVAACRTDWAPGRAERDALRPWIEPYRQRLPDENVARQLEILFSKFYGGWRSPGSLSASSTRS